MSSIFDTFSQLSEARKVSEEADVKKVIKDLIDQKPSDDNKEQGQTVQLLRGLAFSDEKEATAFMKKLMELISTENFGSLTK